MHKQLGELATLSRYWSIMTGIRELWMINRGGNQRPSVRSGKLPNFRSPDKYPDLLRTYGLMLAFLGLALVCRTVGTLKPAGVYDLPRI